MIRLQKINSCHNGSAPFIYDFPKLHKVGIPLRPIFNKISGLLKINSDHIDPALFIYGFLKLHKVGISLRQIVSKINAPPYILLKFLCNILCNVIGRIQYDYYIKDSWEFLEFIKKQTILKLWLVSLDVTSLYTNIYITLAIHLGVIVIKFKTQHVWVLLGY